MKLNLFILHFNMRKFLLKTVLTSFIIILLTILTLLASSVVVKSKGFNNYTSESNLLFLQENSNYDVLFMGISHARNFSRHKNHLRIEKILDKRIVNIGQGGGSCGVNEQHFYLDYFLYKKNSTSKIVYVLSPPLLFSQTLPIASNTFNNETFELPFLWRYLGFKSENKSARVMSYLQTKFHRNWLFKKPNTLESRDDFLEALDRKAVKKGQNLAYDGENLYLNRFKKSTEVVEQTIKLAKDAKIEIILLIPPALFGKWRGHQETFNFMQSMAQKYNVKTIDCSESVLDPILYYDSHHLNTKGVVYFTNKYLKPIIK